MYWSAAELMLMGGGNSECWSGSWMMGRKARTAVDGCGEMCCACWVMARWGYRRLDCMC